MIYIVDYGVGNLNSICNIIKYVGGRSQIISTPEKLPYASKIIIPGVGAFDHGMKELTNRGWIDVLNRCVLENDTYVLGICLGMQLLCKSSEEGVLPGLGWIDAEVKHFQRSDDRALKIPHMGWNTVTINKENPLIKRDTDEQRFYFVHSYHAVCNNVDDVLATSNHGYNFTAALNHKNIFGVQFHPEKSHRFGASLLEKFISL